MSDIVPVPTDSFRPDQDKGRIFSGIAGTSCMR
jgi:hypothetical protein